jgi:predicted amidophosphoribosyltransferase
MPYIFRLIPFSVPAPEAICPGCGSFRRADQPYCRSCLQEVQARWPETLAQKREELLECETGTFPLVDDGVVIL